MELPDSFAKEDVANLLLALATAAAPYWVEWAERKFPSGAAHATDQAAELARKVDDPRCLALVRLARSLQGEVPYWTASPS